MAGSKKKSKKPENVDSGSEEESMSDESESGTYHGQNEIQATFEGRNPEPQDFHGIKQLLLQLFLKAHIDLSQMSDMLIAQNGVGSVLKQSYADSDDEDDADISEENEVFGITSVINLSSHKETPCVQQLLTLLQELSAKYADVDTQAKIKTILKDSNRLGYLINERFINIPAKISSVMFNSLQEEIERIRKKDASYNFDHYILICKTCRPKESMEEIFSNDEEELFVKEADVNFEFSVEKETDSGLGGRWLSEDKNFVPYRRVLIFRADKLRNIIAQVTAFVQ